MERTTGSGGGLVRAVALLAAAGALGGCLSDDLDGVRDVQVETHVEDWRDEIIYQLITDRFANGNPGNDVRVEPNVLARYQGGDWQGIAERMDYLEQLGVTAIWISPIVLNVDTDADVDGYHGYWQVDFEKLNPHFGDLATLRRMVQIAHERGIKVILDIVTNHMGQVFYYDINMNGSPDESVFGGFPTNPGDPMGGSKTPVTRVTEFDPDYDPRGIQAFTSLGEAGPAPIRFFDMPEIFRVPPQPPIFQEPEAYNRRGRVTDWNAREQVVKADFPGGLKDINTLNPEVQQELIRVFSDWVLKLDLDGFRIDTAKHVEHEFWQEFTRGVRERLAERGKHNFLMFGEAFDGDDALIGSYTAPGEMDSVFYFSQKFRVYDDVFKHGGPTTRVEELYELRDDHYGGMEQPMGIGVPPQQALVNFIDNHDVARFLWRDASPEQLRAALGYLLTQDGIPCIYYGTEQEFAGGNDPANREPLWWSDYDTSGETFQWIARLTRVRKQYTALRRGGFEIKWVTERTEDEQDAGILAFERETGGDYALVVVNTQDKMSETSASSLGGGPMPVDAAAGSTLVDALTGDEHTVGSDGTMNLRVGPYETKILVPADAYAAI